MDMSKKKIIFAFISTMFLISVVLVGIHIVTRNKNQPSKSGAANPVSVYFETESVNVNKNSDFSVKIKIDPQSEKITGIELNLGFDKNKISLQGLDKSSAFPYVLQQASINNNNGTATIVVGVAVPPANPASGISDVIILRGKSKEVLGQGILRVEQTSKAAASGQSVNVIKSYGSMTVNVNFPTATPTTTPTATETPTSSPTGQPTFTPSPTPSGTATPTPTGTATSTATPTPSPTGSPSGKSGDVNGDNVVNIVDIGIIIDNYGFTPPIDNRADLNKDNIVNIIDIGIVIDNYGK